MEILRLIVELASHGYAFIDIKMNLIIPRLAPNF